MRTIAFYLPQFHTFPENDAWWGKGFTEWTNMKRAEPLFEGHNQPRVPQNENYYDLLDDGVKKWQIELARKNGIYGFCFYHYWFDGKLLMEKPVEQFLNNRELDMPFCICWANEHWTKAWEGKQNQVLIAQKYGGKKEWDEHFNYLLPFFEDERYIRNNGKPLMIIYRPDLMESSLNPMLDRWQELAREHGFELEFGYQQIIFDLDKNKDDSRFTYNIEYQPNYAIYDLEHNKHRFLKAVKRKISKPLYKLGINIEQVRAEGLIKRDYDEVWNAVLDHTPADGKCVAGAFVDWDNTPRKKEKGSVFLGAEPDKFRDYMKRLIEKEKNEYKKDMIFLFAWNEWAEGGYMEPDEKYGTAYLEALKAALDETGEFPEYPAGK